jgi:hypothetical protein
LVAIIINLLSRKRDISLSETAFVSTMNAFLFKILMNKLGCHLQEGKGTGKRITVLN